MNKTPKGNLSSNSDSGSHWTVRDRLIVYSCALLLSVFIGLGLTYIWFQGAISKQKVLNDAWMTDVVRDSRDPNALKILFVGNSLIYNASLPQQFATIYESKVGKPLKVYQVVIPGESLQGHLQKGFAKTYIERKGPWDVVVIQEWSGGPLKTNRAMMTACDQFVNLIRNARARPYLFMTYADKGKFEDQKAITSVYNNLGHKYNIPVIPDGELWFVAQNRYPDLNLYSTDNHHPNEVGSYLGALLTFCVLTGENPDAAPSTIFVQGKKEVTIADLSGEDHQKCIALVKDYMKCYQRTCPPVAKP